MLSILKKKNSGGDDKDPNDHRLVTFSYIHEMRKNKDKINIIWSNNHHSGYSNHQIREN